MGIFFALYFLALLAIVFSHARWKCPPPRDVKDKDGNHIDFENTGNKVHMPHYCSNL